MHFLVRTCVDRLAGDGGHTIAKEMEEVKLRGLHRVRTSDPKGNVVDAVLEIRYRRIKVLPPIGKQSRYRALSLTVIHASERDTPANRKPIEWKLITDLPVTSRREAIEKLDWYAMRWKIETFHKILKSGCNAEESRLRTAERLASIRGLVPATTGLATNHIAPNNSIWLRAAVFMEFCLACSRRGWYQQPDFGLSGLEMFSEAVIPTHDCGLFFSVREIVSPSNSSACGPDHTRSHQSEAG